MPKAPRNWCSSSRSAGTPRVARPDLATAHEALTCQNALIIPPDSTFLAEHAAEIFVTEALSLAE
jgi:hypothetical protein